MNTATHLQDLSKLAYNAYAGTSFSPDVRAKNLIAEYEALLSSDLQKVPDSYKEKYTTKFKQHLSAWLNAKSRIVSPMIAGPSNFPVQRMQKYNSWEDNKRNEFINWRERILKAFERSERKRNQGSELEQAVKELEFCKRLQEAKKTANAIIRKYKGAESCLAELMEKTGLKEDTCREILKPDYMGRLGFPQFELTNNLAKIKRLEQRVKMLQSKEDLKQKQETEGVKDVYINGVKINSDATDDRLKIFFDGKPTQNVIAALKSHGFIWSPYLKCWCRKLTRQAQTDAVNIINKECK